MSLKDQIGKSSGSYEEVVSSERMSAFCRAVGALDSAEAPPTFLTICRKGEFELLGVLGMALSQVLHAEQEYEHREVIRAGDRLSYSTQLASALEKRSGTGLLKFLVFETIIRIGPSEDVRIACSSRTTVVVRG